MVVFRQIISLMFDGSLGLIVFVTHFRNMVIYFIIFTTVSNGRVLPLVPEMQTFILQISIIRLGTLEALGVLVIKFRIAPL